MRRAALLAHAAWRTPEPVACGESGWLQTFARLVLAIDRHRPQGRTGTSDAAPVRGRDRRPARCGGEHRSARGRPSRGVAARIGARGSVGARAARQQPDQRSRDRRDCGPFAQNLPYAGAGRQAGGRGSVSAGAGASRFHAELRCGGPGRGPSGARHRHAGVSCHRLDTRGSAARGRRARARHPRIPSQRRGRRQRPHAPQRRKARPGQPADELRAGPRPGGAFDAAASANARRRPDRRRQAGALDRRLGSFWAASAAGC